MAGYPVTGDVDVIRIVQLGHHARQTTDGVISGRYPYYLDGDTRIFTQPVQYADVADFLQAIGNTPAAFGLVGNGLTERHIVTAYQDSAGSLSLFDPKISDGTRFIADYDHTNPPPFSMGAFLRTRFGSEDTFQVGGRNARYVSLGTQSAWDGATCGFHVGAMLNAIGQFRRNDPPTAITPQRLLDAMGNPVADGVATLGQEYRSADALRFSTFMKSAWNDTFLRNQPTDTPASAYFFGWHGVEETLPFGPVVETLRSGLKLITALPARVLAEVSAFTRQSLMETAPKNGFTQSLRSGAMLLTYAFEGICRGFGMLFQTVLEPLRVAEPLIARVFPAQPRVEGANPFTQDALQRSPGSSPALGAQAASQPDSESSSALDARADSQPGPGSSPVLDTRADSQSDPDNLSELDDDFTEIPGTPIARRR